jgi:hypothetical protein
VKAYRWLLAAALLATAVLRSAHIGHAASAQAFKGDSCLFRAQLWAVNQSLAAALTTFDKNMQAVYGGNNP